MKAFNAVLPLILTAFIATVACGDDDDDTPPPQGKAGAAGSAGAGGSAAGTCKGTFAGITEAQLKAGRGTSGACISDNDVKGVCVNDVSAATQSCALGCLVVSDKDEERLACTKQCLPGKLGEPKPSEACQTCYINTVACALKFCLDPCSSSPSGTECVTCRQTNGCTPNFFTCSGLPSGAPSTGGAGGAGGAGAGGAGGTSAAGAGGTGTAGGGAGGSSAGAGGTSAGAGGAAAGAGGAAAGAGGAAAGAGGVAGVAGTG